MLSLYYLQITDDYIKAFVDLSSKYENLHRDIEYVRLQMGALRYDLYSIKISDEEREEIDLLLERYLVLFRELMIERDKIPKPLFIRIPYCPEFFTQSPLSSPGNYRYRSHYS
jgi:hypothetical protein